MLVSETMAPSGSARSGMQLMLSADLPTPSPVSVVLATLDEQATLRDCLSSLLAQDYEGPIEILVVDGGSRDATRLIAAGAGPTVRVIDNPRVTAAAAMNIGCRHADADIIVRADAHSLYAPDYVRQCAEALENPEVAMVGGPMRPVGLTSFGRAVAVVTSSPLGVGPGRFHYATERTEVDTVYLGAFHRAVIEAAGGYDEVGLQWAAEDHELNMRIRQRGGRIVLDPAIRSWYFPRQTPGTLWRQYFNYGRGKASTLAKHRRLPTWRPLVPAAMVAGAAATVTVAAASRRPGVAIAPVAGYLATTAALGWRFGADPGVAPHRASLALGICHWAYGLGFWAGVGRIVTGRPFDSRPTSGRV